MEDIREALHWLRLWISCTAVLLLLTATSLCANHIIGGNISMQAVGTTPGLFRIQLNQYWDENRTSAVNRDPTVTLSIYRKQNPILIDTITIPLRDILPLTAVASPCTEQLNMNFTGGRYEGTRQFDPALFNDPGGYYIVWERCCRNDALSNVANVGQAGVALVFYLEFPAVRSTNQPLINSSPTFKLPKGDYICINKPFTFDVGATDADGDQLRYSLVTPLNGYTTSSNTLGNSSVKPGYPPVTWAPGISLTNVIPGNPPLRIDPTTGQVSVQATTQGLFLFTVQCEEFRNGQRIGLVRQDFQLPVIDCSVSTPLPAVVTIDNVPQTSIVSCSTRPPTLAVTRNPLYAYQWQRDGVDLPGDTMTTLIARTAGRYTVVTSVAGVCSNEASSAGVQVTMAAFTPVVLSLTGQLPYCTGDTITLRATGQPGYQYHWRRNEADIAGEEEATLRVRQSGEYVVLARSAGSVCDGADTVEVTINARPPAQLTASTLAFCSGESAELTVPDGPGYRYAWQRDGSPIPETTNRLATRQSGTYRVTVTNPAGCLAASEPIKLTSAEPVPVTLDSIPPVCLGDGSVVSLRGMPGGGVYAGPGVTGDRFSPSVAGVGRHRLTYMVTSPTGCRTEQARFVLVKGSPALTGPTGYRIIRGDSVRLQTQTDESISRYRWDPPTDLSRADVASPVANPGQTSSYQLTAIGATGCVSTLSVRVEVVQSLYIPSAFTPNADGQNDAWRIENIGSFPLCEVSVYDRWGALVFYSKGYARPWDGTYREERVGAGVYSYQIATGSAVLNTVYRGKLTVVY